MAGTHLEFEHLPGITDARISKSITTPKGNHVRAVVTGSTVTLTSAKRPHSDIVIVGGGGDTMEVPLLGDIVDGITSALGSALGGLVKLIKSAGCTMVTTTTVNVSNGQVTGITTTTSCVPN
jgi:hypothetical protein